MDVGMDGMAELKLGKQAVEKATNPNVKAFGQRLVADQGKAGEESKTLAASKQMTLPMMAGPGHKATHDRLAKLSGAEFDRAHVRGRRAGHKRPVTLSPGSRRAETKSDVTGHEDPTVDGEHLRKLKN